MKDEKTGVKCFIPDCPGEIVARYFIPHITRSPGGRSIVGPASRNIATEADRRLDGYHCDNCGIEYHHLPKN